MEKEYNSIEEYYTEDIFNSCDNLETLSIVKYLINIVLCDIEEMEEMGLINEKDCYDLGNNTIIKNEDLESLVSITETIDDIINYNKK